MKRKLLSVCISTYNRPEAIKKNLQNLINCDSDNYDIVVQDCGNNEETQKIVQSFNSDKIKYHKKVTLGNNSNAVMDNWRTALLRGDGEFVLYLNDRDSINVNELYKFIGFLDKNRNVVAGVCNRKYGAYCVYKNENYRSFLNIPYNSYHPSGLVFRRDNLDNISDLNTIFTEKKCFIHPHDLLLAELSCLGPLFSYTRKLWSLADNTSFKNNTSYFYDDNKVIDDFWFSPKNRLIEFDLFVKHMLTLKIPRNIIEKKAINVSKRYLYLSTFNFAYYLEDEGQTAHYGIKRRKVEKSEFTKLKHEYINNSYRVLEGNGIIIPKKKYASIMNLYFHFLLIVIPVWESLKKHQRAK